MRLPAVELFWVKTAFETRSAKADSGRSAIPMRASAFGRKNLFSMTKGVDRLRLGVEERVISPGVTARCGVNEWLVELIAPPGGFFLQTEQAEDRGIFSGRDCGPSGNKCATRGS